MYEPLVNNKYEKWLKLSDIENVKPSGFVVQFSFFAQGSANAHIIFSPVENPSLLDDVYEVVLGGFGNTRIMIRKRSNGVLLADVIVPNSLNVLKRKQFVFEVLNDGEIRLFGEDSLKPLLTAFDPKPLNIAYISFKNLNNEKLSFFYGYNPEQLPNVIVPIVVPTTKRPYVLPTRRPLLPFIVRPISPQSNIFDLRNNLTEEPVQPTEVISEIGTKDPTTVKYEPVVMHPLFKEILPVNVDLPTLVKNSQYVESWSNNALTSLIKVTGNMQSAGYILRFPFYVRGARDASVLLWPGQGRGQDFYEIQMGAIGGNLGARILRGEKVLAEIVEENLLNEWKLNKVIIEVTNDGIINLYTEHNQWAPLLTVVDSNPINVKLITFGSEARAQFFYDVNEKLLSQPLPVDRFDELEQVELPIFSAIQAPIGHELEWLNKYFKVIDTSKLTAETNQQLIHLGDLQLGTSDHLVYLPLFINGAQNARISLLWKNSVTGAVEDAYIINIGTLMNTRIEIRKYADGPIISKAIVPNLLSNVKAKLFHIEVTNEGWIRVYSEDDHMNPLISTFDPYPVKIEYVRFGSYQNEPLKFYYDYDYNLVGEQLPTQLVSFKYNFADLTKNCKSHVVDSTEFKQFIQISALESVQVNQIGKALSFYVDGTKDTSIVLADTLAPNRDVDYVYEICKCTFLFY